MGQTKVFRGTASALRQVQQHARSVLSNLRRNIRDRQAELKKLKAEEEVLSHVVGVEGPGTVAVPSANGTGRGRTNWGEVLNRLPKQFKVSDVEQLNGLKGRTADISAAITRWINAGLARRKARGLYERV